MNLRDLHYFVVLADVMHFGEAARRCHVSQPTLSMQLKKLEEELGVPLFERTNKQVMLTDSGRMLLSRAQHILTQITEMKEIIRMGFEPMRLELFTRIPGVNFSECYERRVFAKIGRLMIPFIGLEDLKLNKRASGRLKDLQDLEELP